jgi:NAD-dependent SIR2 family protein deacetylase
MSILGFISGGWRLLQLVCRRCGKQTDWALPPNAEGVIHCPDCEESYVVA